MNEQEILFGKCPVTTAQKVIGGKWALVIFFHLHSGTKRFGELQRLIPGITQTMLTKQLRSLEEFGLVKRRIYTEVPPRVEYSLSVLGREFVPVIDALEVWGGKYIEYLNGQRPV